MSMGSPHRHENSPDTEAAVGAFEAPDTGRAGEGERATRRWLRESEHMAGELSPGASDAMGHRGVQLIGP